MLDFNMIGFAKCMKNLEAVADVLEEKELLDALEEAAEPMAEAMSDKAPTGETRKLESNIIIVREDGTIKIGPSKEAFYGGLQETGTKKHGAQPFMRPAFDETEDKVIERFIEITGKKIDRAVK